MSNARTLTGTTSTWGRSRSAARPTRTNTSGGGLNRPRAALAALAVLVFAAAFALPLGGATAQEPTAIKLVSTTGQSTVANSPFDIDRAQSFRTGSNAGGYTLTKVTFPVAISNSVNNTQLRIESMSTSGRPSGNLGTLTLTISGGTATGTASGSGIQLAANTGYFVVLLSNSTTGIVYQRTGSDSEDAGAAAGWSIGDTSWWFSHSGQNPTTPGHWGTSSHTWKIAIHGYAKTASDTPSSTPSGASTRSSATYVAVGDSPRPTGAPSVDAGRSVEETAKAAVATVLDVPEADLQHESTEEVIWGDSSLGCMQIGFAYTPVMTPGREVDFRHGEETPSARVPDHGRHIVVCRGPAIVPQPQR